MYGGTTDGTMNSVLQAAPDAGRGWLESDTGLNGPSGSTTRLYEASATRYQGATHAGYMVGDTIAANRAAGREHSGGAAEAEGQAWWNPEKWMPSSVDFWRSL